MFTYFAVLVLEGGENEFIYSTIVKPKFVEEGSRAARQQNKLEKAAEKFRLPRREKFFIAKNWLCMSLLLRLITHESK